MVSDRIKQAYLKNLKKMLIIPIALLLFSIIFLGVKYGTTGSFIEKDISLKGGLSLTIPYDQEVNIPELEAKLMEHYADKEISIKEVTSLGIREGLIIEADLENDKKTVDGLIDNINQELGSSIKEGDYSIEYIGSSLGQSFFRETIIAVAIAFIFMGLVVFLYFRTFVPSGAVILAALSDIVVTIAIVDLLGIKLSAAGIAAFLMLIGYSVDTDILLTTKVLKRKENTLEERLFGAIKTGFTMSITTLAAMMVALIFTQSEVIRQIMLILLIGLVIDMINTWIQNTGILLWYVKKNAKKDN